MRQAIAYIRASTDDQRNSLEAQRERLADYCRYKGIHLVDTFVDAGVSGSTPFDQRPEGRALLDFRAQAGITEIIFTKVDRAFRDAADCMITIKGMHAEGIEVHALDLDLDTTTANGKLMLGMMALLAEWELNRRRERQEEVLTVLRDQSRVIGEVPYGYLAVEDATLPDSKRGNTARRLIPDPDEQATLQTIFELAGEHGWGAKRIATWLTNEGIPTKKGKPRWAGVTVQGLLDRATLSDGRTATDFQTETAA